MKIDKILLTGLILCTLSIHAQTKDKRPKNIIFLIGDGMGLSQISHPIMTSAEPLSIMQFHEIGLMTTHAYNNKITDSGAGATAFAIGKKTNNGAISVDHEGVPFETILESANKHGLSTGMVTTCAITHATPACFIAHEKNRNKTENIANDFLKTPIDIFVGGGLKDFEKRKDGKNLCDSLLARNYSVYKNENDFFAADLIGKTAAFIADGHPLKMSEGRGDYQRKAVRKALNLLKQNKNGFFLMVEGSQIDWGGHDNDAEYIYAEMMDFDSVIKEVLDFAKKDGNTLVVVTADHETGGFALTADKNNEQNSDNYGAIFPTFTSKGHSASLVPVFAFGPGSSLFKGFIDNTDIYKNFKSLFGF